MLCPRGNEVVLDYGSRRLWDVSLVDGGGWDRCVGIIKIGPPVSTKRKERLSKREERESKGARAARPGQDEPRGSERRANGPWGTGTGRGNEGTSGGEVEEYQVGLYPHERKYHDDTYPVLILVSS